VGVIVPVPYPLRTCPGLENWLRRSGEEYRVFVDETFHQFFELDPRGYFCHGAVGIPERDYKAVRQAMAPIFQRYRELLVPELTEFKHREFKRIPFESRWPLAQQIHNVLHEHSCFVSGFYTPARSFLLERIRIDLLNTTDTVPVDVKHLIAEMAERTRAEWTGPGMSTILNDLFHKAIAGWLNFADGIKIRLRVVIDPREPKEDKAIKEALLKAAETVAVMVPPTLGRLLDVDVSRTSDEEVGLQLADLIAGEVRVFLEANSELLEFGSSPKLITAKSDEAIQAWEDFRGVPFKQGSITRMPNALRRRFFSRDPKGRSVLPCFADLFASGMVTCFGSWGTPRHIMFYDGLLYDQLD